MYLEREKRSNFITSDLPRDRAPTPRAATSSRPLDCTATSNLVRTSAPRLSKGNAVAEQLARVQFVVKALFRALKGLQPARERIARHAGGGDAAAEQLAGTLGLSRAGSRSEFRSLALLQPPRVCIIPGRALFAGGIDAARLRMALWPARVRREWRRG